MQEDHIFKQENYYFDSHTHLLDYNQQQLTYNLDQNLKHKVIFVSSCTTHSLYFQPQLNLYHKYSLPLTLQQPIKKAQKITIIPSFGIHPCFIQHQKDNPQWIHLLQKVISENQLFGVGQIGLDFRTNTLQTNSKQDQMKFFRVQFEIALKFNRTVTVHCVRAYGQILNYFKKYNKDIEAFNKNNQNGIKYQGTPIIMHSYGGSKEITQALLKLTNLNIYFSLSLKRSQSLCTVIPLQRLLLETDAPYQLNHQLLLQQKMISQQEYNKGQTQRANEVNFVRANYTSLYPFYKIPFNDFSNSIVRNSLKAFRLLL